eukprot:gene1125-biopygen15275
MRRVARCAALVAHECKLLGLDPASVEAAVRGVSCAILSQRASHPSSELAARLGWLVDDTAARCTSPVSSPRCGSSSSTLGTAAVARRTSSVSSSRCGSSSSTRGTAAAA